ncbi:glycerol 3 phosphate dehydrogenase [Trichuris trichiura]|uniref:Glycerol-3-phosphate dehydrogenase n=1 Tax=Trichuris trichiura TaxID=36087 RepID=A0A077Z4W8_TRITR|nr:glycerol 3 phosphate dehydrogenase [Trichuris trichiura]
MCFAGKVSYSEESATYFLLAYQKFFVNAATRELQFNNNLIEVLPTRGEIMRSLKETEEFDVLVIGGGATGAGVALDAQTRGLKTALVEMDDFGSGTSSRSTKLIHGGVRYLQSAILKFDYEQYRMVKEALFERYHLIQVAPHLSSVLPIMLPIYKWWQVPYYYLGIKAYDFVAGSRRLKSSYYINKERALELFPLLRKESLVGALIYYDGQHNDARMNLSLILTAIRYGAQCINHVEVLNLTYNELNTPNRRVSGVIARDRLTGQEMHIRAKCVVNATGAFCDTIRVMDDPKVPLLVVPSQGVHIILPAYYSPSKAGLLDPSTSDGRVIFFLPWLNMTMAGTTDSPCEITDRPAPAEKDVEFILNEIRHYLVPDVSIRRGDVMSAWAGLRPLVRDPKKTDTASLARNHIIEVSAGKLITIAGGKWTTYRHMAEETVNKAVEVCDLKPKNGCVTAGLMLEGGRKYHPLLYIRLVQDFGLDFDVATHLATTYGDKAYKVARMSRLTGQRYPIVGKKLHNEFPYIEAEVIYAVKEYACTTVDFLSRRTRFAFLNTYAAEEALPRVVELMGQELKWNKEEKKRQMALATEFLQFQMGANARQKAYAEAPLMLTQEERENAIKCFKEVDKDRNGGISMNDLRRYFEERGEKINENELHRLLDEVDLNKNGEIDLCEFLQVYSGLKGGWVCQNPFAHYLSHEMNVLTPERSGGGV